MIESTPRPRYRCDGCGELFADDEPTWDIYLGVNATATGINSTGEAERLRRQLHFHRTSCLVTGLARVGLDLAAALESWQVRQ